IATLGGWVRSQYQIEPSQNPLPCDHDEAAPAGQLALAARPPAPNRPWTFALHGAAPRGAAPGARASSGARAGPPPPARASGGELFVLEHVNGNSERHEDWPPRVRKVGRDGRVTTLADLSRRPARRSGGRRESRSLEGSPSRGFIRDPPSSFRRG